jgi:putative heme-binding domain-containing protein
MYGRMTVMVGVVALLGLGLVASAQEAFSLRSGDVVVFAGGTNMYRLHRSGQLESMLTTLYADAKPTFRDLSWEADTVYRQGTVTERWRTRGFGRHEEQFERLKTTVIIAQFGQLEAMEGDAKLEAFKAAYNALIDDYLKHARTVVLVSPTPFEKPESVLIRDNTALNASLALYVKATLDIARTRKLHFIDLFSNAEPGLTKNGRHTTENVQETLADAIVRQLDLTPPGASQAAALLPAVLEKNRLWFDYWRPANWKLLYGDDSRRKFTKGTVPFREEWNQLLPLLAKADQRIWTVATGGKDPGHSRPEPELLFADPDANIAKEHAAFTLPEGLKVNLFADETLGLTTPLNIRWDPNGRAWVSVTTAYPHIYPGDVFNDKILILEDSDGDRRADSSTVFAEGLNIPTGFELGDGGVYIGESTEVTFLRDTNGDDKADTKEVMLAGFGSGDSHQTINSFSWSPGGDLYMGQGDGVESRVDTPWGSRDLFQAGLYRMRPRRLQIDPLFDDFMGPANPWGVAFTEWGQMIVVDGAGGVTNLSLGQIPTTHKLRPGRIGSPGGYCGVGYIDGGHLPKKYHGMFALGDFKSNRVKLCSVKAKGASLKLTWHEPLLQSSHRNFRPVDVKMGPDGAVYVVDWYNNVTCHQNDAYRHERRDKAHGRIWRISADTKPIKPPMLSGAALPTVLDALMAPEHWTRYQAKRELSNRDAEQASQAIDNWLPTLDAGDENYERHLFEALGACATIEVLKPALLRRVAAAKTPGARAFACRIAGRWHDRMDGALDILAAGVRDDDAQVRMEAVSAVAQVADANAIVVAAAVVDKPMDKALDYVLTQAVHNLKPLWEPAFVGGELAFEKPAHLAAVLNIGGGRTVMLNLRRIADSDEHESKSRLDAIRAILEVGTPSELREYGFDATRFATAGKYDPIAHRSVLEKMLAVSVSRDLRPDGDLAALLAPLLSQQDASLTAAALRLAGAWKVRALEKQVVALANDPNLPTTTRAAAFAAVADMSARTAAELLSGYAAKPHPVALRSAAIEALCTVDTAVAASHAATLFADDVALNPTAILKAFLARKNGGSVLATGLGRVELSEAFAAKALHALYATGRTDKALIDVLKESAGVAGIGQPYNRGYVKTLAADAAKNGNADRGMKQAVACFACHQLGNTGAVIGPDLSAIGTTLTAERIIEDLLWPEREIKEGYTLLQVTTKDGQVHQGFERRTRESEMSGDLAMRQLAVESLITIKKSEIADKRELGSAMPAGLTSGMSRQDLLDLIRYLTTLGAVAEGGFVSIFDGKTLAGWEPSSAKGEKAWTVKDGVIRGDGDHGGRGYLVYVRDKELANFELKLSYRFPKPGRANSGISIRAVPDKTGRRDFQCYHADLGHLGIGKKVLGAWDFHTPGRKEHRCFRGDSLVISETDKPTITPVKDALREEDIKKGDWNDVHIIASSNRFQLYINGKLASEFTENLPAAKRLHKGMIQLQLHDPGMIVEFKNIRLKVLK